MKSFILTCLLLFTITLLKSQSNHFELQLGYLKTTRHTPFFHEFHQKEISSRILYNYSKYFESGIYLGYRHAVEQHIFGNRYLFGLHQTFNILPILIKHQNRFNIYLPFSLGGNIISNKTSVQRLYFYELSFGIGMSMHLLKKWGIYLEYSFDNKNQYNYKPYLQFGISYNWGKTKDE